MAKHTQGVAMRYMELDNTLFQKKKPEYKELSYEYEEGSEAVWVIMEPQERQCYTLTLLLDLLALFQNLDEFGSPWPDKPGNVKYMILCSRHPEIFNTGGDLQYFHQLVLERDRDRLMEYAVGCIDLIYWALTGGARQMTTIAHVAGEALGGGFEAALACNYIFAEKQSKFGFPEVVFGFFPGMGGYPLMKRFVGGHEADVAFNTGKRYSATKLNDLGAIYRLTDEGEGKKSIEEFIEIRKATEKNNWALQKLKQRTETIDYDLLKYNIELWVDSALNLSKNDLRIMQILVKRQIKRLHKK